jgi:hypothetical protein
MDSSAMFLPYKEMNPNADNGEYASAFEVFDRYAMQMVLTSKIMFSTTKAGNMAKATSEFGLMAPMNRPAA